MLKGQWFQQVERERFSKICKRIVSSRFSNIFGLLSLKFFGCPPMRVIVDAVKTSHKKVCLHWFWALNLPSRGLVALARFHAGRNRHSFLSEQCLELLLACYFQAHRPGKTPPSLPLLVHQLYCCLNFPKALSCFAFFWGYLQVERILCRSNGKICILFLDI